ncbi:MAG: DUF1036 domain-containing protein [Pseudomonadota bacterium]
MTTWHQIRRFGLALTVVLAASVWGTEAARADMTICNYSRGPVDVAIGYYDHDFDEWVSAGWYEVRAGKCDTLFVLHEFGPEEYVYVYAESQLGDGEWSGEYSMCIDYDAFEIYGWENCKARGYYSYGFVELDVRNASSFTYDLIE